MFKWTIEIYGVRVWTGLIGSAWVPEMGSCKQGVHKRGREYLSQLSDYVVMKDSAP
jgi:hypothetical protein